MTHLYQVFQNGFLQGFEKRVQKPGKNCKLFSKKVKQTANRFVDNRKQNRSDKTLSSTGMKHFLYPMLIICTAISLIEAAALPARAKTVRLPLRIDYPMLDVQLASELASAPGGPLVLTDPEDPCRQIRLSEPSFARHEDLLRLEMAVSLDGGTFVAGNCLLPARWEGYIHIFAQPRMDQNGWNLTFDWQDSRLLNPEREPAAMMNKLWSFFRGYVFSRLENLSINLKPPVEALDSTLLPMAAPEDNERLEAFLRSLSPAAPVVTPAGLVVSAVGELEIPAGSMNEPPPAPLSPGELERFVGTWETWDVFLVNAMLELSGEPLSREEREILFEVLIETRYRFVEELEKSRHKTDFVREQFVSAWGKLSLVFRSHLADGSAPGDPLAYLAFFTASDALAVLDSLGPAINIEISRDGLIRLARLITSDKSIELECSTEVNDRLRTLLGLGPALEACGPAFEKNTMDLTREKNQSRTKPVPILSHLLPLLSAERAWAAVPDEVPGIAELRSWLVSRKNLEDYLDRVKTLLSGEVQESLQEGEIPGAHRQLFQDLVFATAWQESCFRQFIVKDRKLTYLRSYNNTSVGMMQINERVWRGMYDLQHLRWNVDYNVAAGIEILERYLMRYALRRLKSFDGLTAEALAGSVYAMYNGGPGQFEKYFARRKANDFYATDRYFLEKYRWVKKDAWQRLNKCLF
jgi:hypothetical protein